MIPHEPLRVAVEFTFALAPFCGFRRAFSAFCCFHTSSDPFRRMAVNVVDGQ
jgi:hypothetical protein